MELSMQIKNVEQSNRQYVPRAHVKFLEQAGFRVAYVDYTLSASDLKARLDEVNGLYLHGDSIKALEFDSYVW